MADAAKRPRDDGGWDNRELHRALALARLSGLEHLIVQEAIDAAWVGPSHGPRPFFFDMAWLTELAHCARMSLLRTRDSLVDKGILEPFGRKGFALNLDYRSWIDPETGGPLLDARQVAHCERDRQPESPPGRPDFILVDW